jgi:hypothetical protein
MYEYRLNYIVMMQRNLQFTQGRMGQILRKAWIKPSQGEPYSSWQNRVEIAIKAIKRAVHQYCDQNEEFPNERRKIGKWLGVAH